MNRAVGRRPLFDSDADMRRFESLLARAVDDGLIRIHAYCLMTTHFHLVTESPEGRLDEAMHGAQGNFSRWFNQLSDRPGPLFRNRYHAKRIEDTDYRDAVLWYIDRNPVVAGIVARPADYPYGSAFHYHRPPGPRWLTRTLVESIAAPRHGGTFDPARYGVAPAGASDARCWRALDAFAGSTTTSSRPIVTVLAPRPEHIERWLDANAQRADGVARRIQMLDAEAIDRAIPESIDRHPDAYNVTSAAQCLRVGLHARCAGSSLREIAALTGLSLGTVLRRARDHRTAMAAVPSYRAAAVEVVQIGSAELYAPIFR